MIRKPKASSSSLFLMELILSILIFALASAVCVSFFVRSHTLSVQAQEMNRAVQSVDQAAELIRGSTSTEDLEQQLQQAYPNIVSSGSLDAELTYTVTEDSTGSTLTIVLKQDGRLVDAGISCRNAESTSAVFETEIQRYYREEAAQ